MAPIFYGILKPIHTLQYLTTLLYLFHVLMVQIIVYVGLININLLFSNELSAYLVKTMYMDNAQETSKQIIA